MLSEASLLQPVAKLLDGVHEVIGVLTLLEGGGVHKVAVEGAHLAGQGLHQHPNGHTGREGVRVDDQVRPAAKRSRAIRQAYTDTDELRAAQSPLNLPCQACMVNKSFS